MKAAELTLSSSCSQCIVDVRSNVTGPDAEENWMSEGSHQGCILTIIHPGV